MLVHMIKKELIKMVSNNCIKEIYENSNIQQIRGFMLDGEKSNIKINHEESYYERLEKSKSAIKKRLKRLYPDWQERDMVLGELYQALSEHKDVYTEIGMKLGASLAYQLLTPLEANK